MNMLLNQQHLELLKKGGATTWNTWRRSHPATGRKNALPNRHMKFFITHGTISAITSDFSPDCLEEVLAQLGLELP